MTAYDLYTYVFEDGERVQPDKFACGQVWKRQGSDDEYLIATTFRNTVKLINMRTGNRCGSAAEHVHGGFTAEQIESLFEFDGLDLDDWQYVR